MFTTYRYRTSAILGLVFPSAATAPKEDHRPWHIISFMAGKDLTDKEVEALRAETIAAIKKQPLG